MYKGLLKSGKLEATFAAALGNSGNTAITVMWVPRPGGNVPQPRSVFVAPGAQVTLYQGDTLSSVGFRIDVALPDNGSGTLTVKQPDASASWSDQMTEDDTWLFGVDIP